MAAFQKYQIYKTKARDTDAKGKQEDPKVCNLF
jgi:hypothetical protein